MVIRGTWGALVAALALTIGLWCATIGGLEGHIDPATGAAVDGPSFSYTDTSLHWLPNTRAVIPPAGCLFIVGNDGNPVVLSSETGMVLTRGQIKNCSK
jgi:hypothetical protein